MLPRAAAEAAVALLLGGALATGGWAGLASVWGYAVPYGALFLALELLLRKTKANMAMVFTLGMAFACLYEGVYTKAVFDGVGFLGLDTGAAAAALFDWGMLAVMSAHLVSARWKRTEERRGRLAAVPAVAGLGLIVLAMAMVYLVKTGFGHYIVERTLGPTWLLTDALFLAAAAVLLRRGLANEEGGLHGAVYVLCAFASWAPGNEILLVWGERFAWPGILTFLLCASWAVSFAWGFYSLWRWRGVVDETPVSRHPLLLYAAAYRVVGSLALLAAYHPAVFDERTAAAYGLLIDVPTRLAFSYALLGSRLDV